MTDARALRFEILGEVRALRNDDPVDLGPAKQRAVLAVLLLQPGKPVPTHQIVDAVWGDDPPENGANVVQKYVAGLRRALDPGRAPRTPGELLSLAGGGYVLRTAWATVDADDFQTAVTAADVHRRAGRLPEAAERLRAALALWHGDALAGLSGPVFEAGRARLADARAAAWEKWCDIELSRGHQTALIPDLARLVGEFPLREGLRAQLMIALHQAGRQAEALAVFRDAREQFLDEFGAEPGERMQEAHRKILRGEPFYGEPVDPWAEASPVSPPSAYVPPGYAAPAFAPPAAVPVPALLAEPRRPVALEIVLAVLAPFATCGFGSWIYFVAVGVRRRDRKQFAFAALYIASLVGVVAAAAADPSPTDSNYLTGDEWFAIALWSVTTIFAAVHGALTAVHESDHDRQQRIRETARRFAAVGPMRARQLGIGRPQMPRGFGDGGLVDLNNATVPELSLLPGVDAGAAARIAEDRVTRGPFRAPRDLTARGLLPRRAVRRLARQAICLPVDAPSLSWSV